MIFHTVDSDFRKKLSSTYQLSILVGTDSLVYFVFDPVKNKALTLRSFRYRQQELASFDLEKELQQILDMDDIIKLPFQKVNVLLPFSPFTLVPSRLYSESHGRKCLTELMLVSDDDTVQARLIPEFSVHAVYLADEYRKRIILNYFPECVFEHLIVPKLKGFQQLASQSSESQSFVHYQDGRISITVVSGKELIFCNSFICHSAEDVLYYVMLTYDQLKLEPYRNKLYLAGMVMENSDMVRLLQRYFDKPAFIDEIPFLQFSTKFQPVPKHLFFELYATSLL